MYGVALPNQGTSLLIGGSGISAFTPLSLLPDRLYHPFALNGAFQDAGRTTPAVANGDPIGSLTDFSANAVHFTASGANRPTLATGVINGLSAANFVSTLSQYLTGTVLNLTGDFTCLIVCKPVYNGTDRIIMGDNASSKYLLDVSTGDDANSAFVAYYDATNSLSAASRVGNGVWQVLETNVTTGLWVPARDGSSLSGITKVANQAQPFSSIGARNGGSLCFNGQIAAIFLKASYLTASQFAQLRTYYANLCNILNALPQTLVVTGGANGSYNMNAGLIQSTNPDYQLTYRNGPGQVGLGSVFQRRASTLAGLASATSVQISAAPSTLHDWRAGEDNLFQGPDGTIYQPLNLEDGVANIISPPLMMYSTNGGASWSTPTAITALAAYTYLYSYGRIFTPDNGTTYFWPIYGLKTASGYTDSLLFKSTTPKVASSWALQGTIAVGNGSGGTFNYNETCVRPASPTRFVAIIRNDNGDLSVCYSTDTGATWTAPVTLIAPEGNGGVSPDICVSSTGAWILTWGRRTECPGMYALVSYDFGGNWPGPIVPISCQNFDGLNSYNTGGLGYPSTIETAPGVFASIYYVEPNYIDAGQADFWMKTFQLSSLSPQTTLALDQFTDVDGTNLTAHTITPTNTPGHAWVALHGTITTQGNKASCTADSFYTVDFGNANVTLSMTGTLLVLDGSHVVGFLVRMASYTDGWFIGFYGNNNVYIYEIVANVYTLRANPAAGWAADLNPHTFKVVASGSNLYAFVDGVQVAFWGSASTQSTTTKHGMRLIGTVSATTADNYQVTSP